MAMFLGLRPPLAAIFLLLPLAGLAPALAQPVPPGQEGELGKLLARFTAKKSASLAPMTALT
jgi:hypothetical protein